jgi:XTP/dITP diphosphohydrolase
MPDLRRLKGDRLIIATHNEGKRREFEDLLGRYIRNIVSAGALGLAEPEETGTSFTENAILKAKAAAEATQSIALSDDSGLCVNALSGKPGIFSARWALAPGDDKKDFGRAMRRIHEELGNSQDRSAYFICVLALAWPDGAVETVEGRVEGHLIWPPQGEGGHGYDPIFVAKDHNKTFAAMKADEKNELSHRGQAVRKLIEKFFA